MKSPSTKGEAENWLKTPYLGGLLPELAPVVLTLKTEVSGGMRKYDEYSFLYSRNATCKQLYEYVARCFGCRDVELRAAESEFAFTLGKLIDEKSEDTLQAVRIFDSSVVVALPKAVSEKFQPAQTEPTKARHREKRPAFPVLQESIFEGLDGDDELAAFDRGELTKAAGIQEEEKKKQQTEVANKKKKGKQQDNQAW